MWTIDKTRYGRMLGAGSGGGWRCQPFYFGSLFVTQGLIVMVLSVKLYHKVKRDRPTNRCEEVDFRAGNPNGSESEKHFAGLSRPCSGAVRFPKSKYRGYTIVVTKSITRKEKRPKRLQEGPCQCIWRCSPKLKLAKSFFTAVAAPRKRLTKKTKQNKTSCYKDGAVGTVLQEAYCSYSTINTCNTS